MNKNGISIIAAIFIMLVLSVVIAIVASLVATSGDVAINYWESLEAFHIAEAGWARARVRLSTGDWDYRSDNAESGTSIGDGTFTVTTIYDSALDTVTIASTGYVPDSNVPRAKRKVVEEGVRPIGSVDVTASSETRDHPASHAVDGDLNTYWQSKGVPRPHWLLLSFALEIAFNKVIFYQDTLSINIDEFDIRYYDESVGDFVSVKNPVKEGPTGPNNMFTVTFDDVSSNQVKWIVDETVKAAQNISEFEIYDLSGEKVELVVRLEKGTFMEVY